MTTEVEVTKADPSRAVAFKTVDSGPVSAAGEWTIGSQGGETEIVYHGTIEAHGLLRLFEPFMGPTLNKTARRYEQALADRLSA